MQRFFKHLAGLSSFMDSGRDDADSSVSFPIQLAEDNERFVVRTLAPGIREKDLEIVLTGQTLSITGQLPCRRGNYLRQEWPCGTFRRDVELGCRVDADAVEAKLESGVLTVTLPKHKSVRPNRIQVEYGS